MPGTKTNLKLHWNNFLITLCKFSFTILNLKWLCEPIYIHKWPYLSEMKCMYGNICYIYGSFLIINTYTFAMKHHCFFEIQNVMKISGSQITTKWFDYISHDLKHKICPEISTVPRMNKMTGWHKQVSVIIIWGRENWLFYFCLARFYKHLC